MPVEKLIAFYESAIAGRKPKPTKAARKKAPLKKPAAARKRER
jgi:hypothetical protein